MKTNDDSGNKFWHGALFGIGLFSIIEVIVLKENNLNIYDNMWVNEWKETANVVYKERAEESCVDWQYISENVRDENTLTVYYANESWLIQTRDINDICAFVKDYPSQAYDYHLEGREDFVERRHKPSMLRFYNPILNGHIFYVTQNGKEAEYEENGVTQQVPLYFTSSDYVTPRLNGIEEILHAWCEVSLEINPIILVEKFGPRGKTICDTMANANDRYVQITATLKEFTCLAE